ncbi:hypothetical protein [Dactylosporangium darangshiense]|uniref:Uncharacterized protein n=1 Tax=Dactylosporangium darangshiense TaxID=579108 RepID=A0ABP8D531_9ACTN
MKLYSTLERRSLLPALCPSTAVVRRVAPPLVSLQWQESALAQDLVAVSVPVDVPASVPAAVLAAPAAALAPSARVAGVATGSVRVELTVRGTELGGKDETRTDGTHVRTTRIDEIHVASAAQLDQRGIRVQGITGFSAKQDMTAPKPNGGVRGIPPRGRPV